MIAFGICIRSQEKYERYVLPGLARCAEPDSAIVECTDNASILTAYNDMLDAFAQREDLEALVLLREGAELRDEEFARKVREAVRDPDVAVLGVVGARGVQGLEWWQAQGVGHCAEPRGVIDFGSHAGEVDAVEGQMLVLSPWAVRNLRFDSETFSGFHAYDIDLCFQARAAGRKVRVIDINLYNDGESDFGDEVGFRLADAAFRRKWAMPLAPVTQPATCPLCSIDLVAGPRNGQYEVELCPECGLGATFPAPPLSAEGDDTVWELGYGGQRLALRPQWMKEAELRVTWVQLYVPDGRLLEVGSGTGEFVAVAQAHGFDAYGVELSGWAAEQARQLGARVSTEDLRSWRLRNPGMRVDVVAAFHVVEHIHEPREFLREVRRVLAPGGTFAIEVPGFDSVYARRDTFDWIGTALTDHVHHFTARSLVALLEEEGFQVKMDMNVPTRVYDSLETWRWRRNRWRDQGMSETPRDLLRIIAQSPSAPVEQESVGAVAAAA